jgi:hypothetical protein
MEQLNVVLYQNDAATAERLARSLSRYFPAVYRIHNREEIRPTIAKSAAELLVLDVETSGTEEVERHQEFPPAIVALTAWQAMNSGPSAQPGCRRDSACPGIREVVRSLTREHAPRDRNAN